MTERAPEIGPPPPYDTELAGVLAALPGEIPPITLELLPMLRGGFPGVPKLTPIELAGDAFTASTVEAEGLDGAPGVPLVVFRPIDSRPVRGCLYFIHGGGMIMGSPLDGVAELLRYAETLSLAVVTVDYRLAPETPYPGPVDDCFAGLRWVSEHLSEWGIDQSALIVVGGSAGGGLAASTVLRARDEGNPQLGGQLLIAPMLDHRNTSYSVLQMQNSGMWDRASNALGWSALLGEGHAEREVSPYASPSRALELSNLPASYIDVGSADSFRDEALVYADRIWRSGGVAELHIWAGGYHGFDGIAPESSITRSAQSARLGWLERRLRDLHTEG